MSKTFMRGLVLLETIDRHGPLTVTELSERTGVDKSTVSRTLSACEPDGWITRAHGRIALGPRATLLANSSATAALVRQAEPLVQAIHGTTGCLAQAYTLVGRNAVIVASAGADTLDLVTGLTTVIPIYATAAGNVIASQLDPAVLERLLPPEPYPDPMAELRVNPAFTAMSSAVRSPDARAMPAASAIPRTRGALDGKLETVSAQGVAVDRGELHPAFACVSIPWPHPALPGALTCMTTPAELAGTEELFRTVLAAAVAPGATRADIAAAAAGS
jgi:DNA-binding IclR family transcriptional regulator